jgi:hypothetical protein
MNIFILHLNPRTAAEYHCDKHVVKMILETAQLLYTAHWVLDPDGIPPGAYKKTHVNHPCAIWVRESLSNYQWLAELGIELCHEYTHRYGKIHKTQSHLEWLRAHTPPSIPKGPATPMRQAMPDAYKNDDPVQAYRTYYLEDKLRIARYTKRDIPDFLQHVL